MSLNLLKIQASYPVLQQHVLQDYTTEDLESKMIEYMCIIMCNVCTCTCTCLHIQDNRRALFHLILQYFWSLF